MLIYSTERLLPANVNMIVLQDEDGAYYYVHRSLFEQAVIVEDRYKNNIDALKKALGVDPTADESIYVKFFVDTVPRPVNILGYYLYLIDNLDQRDWSLTELCGVIHVISSVMNFRAFLTIPKEARTGVSFSLSIKEEYQTSWDRFFQEARPFDYVPPTGNVSRITATDDRRPEINPSEVATEEDLLAIFDADIDFGLSVGDPNGNDPEPEPEPEPEPVKAQEQATVKSGLGLLGGL